MHKINTAGLSAQIIYLSNLGTLFLISLRLPTLLRKKQTIVLILGSNQYWWQKHLLTLTNILWALPAFRLSFLKKYQKWSINILKQRKNLRAQKWQSTAATNIKVMQSNWQFLFYHFYCLKTAIHNIAGETVLHSNPRFGGWVQRCHSRPIRVPYQ